VRQIQQNLLSFCAQAETYGIPTIFAPDRNVFSSKIVVRTVLTPIMSSTSHARRLLRAAVIGIRREDKSRWERRAPFAPTHVKQLVNLGAKVVVQPSPVRVFKDAEYHSAGAEISENLEPCDTILAVKEVPIKYLLPDRTYYFFSHTIKGQPYNMTMLDEILKRRIRLIDYERIVDNNNARLVKFGRFAGNAGMIDTFAALGDRLLVLGHSTPFLHVTYSKIYPSLESAKIAIRNIGQMISEQGLPNELHPLSFVFTGDGAVTHVRHSVACIFLVPCKLFI